MMFRSSDLLGDFERLTRGLDLGSEFDEMMSGLTRNLATTASFGPGVDAVNTAEAFELHVDLPGIDPSTVDVTVDGHTLTVSATRTFAPGDDAEIVHSGRRHGPITRTFRLAKDLDPDQLSARSEHGVLIVSVPRSATATPRRIEVETAD